MEIVPFHISNAAALSCFNTRQDVLTTDRRYACDCSPAASQRDDSYGGRTWEFRRCRRHCQRHRQRQQPSAGDQSWTFPQTGRNQSAETHNTINLSKVTVIDREPDRLIRLIKEAVYIGKEGPQSMNRDEGSYQLSHAYDRFLGMSSSSSRCAKNRRN